MELIYKIIPFCLPRLKFIKKTKGIRYLDFGCGAGRVLHQNAAVRPDLELFGLDVKDFSQKLPKSVSFSVYDGNKLPYQDSYFDFITVNHVLEHIKTPGNTLIELKRILKKKGRIYIEVPNQRSLWGKPSSRFAGTVHFFDDTTHVRPYSVLELIEICKRHRFKIVKFGVSRNLLHLLLSPFLMLIGVIAPNKLYYMYARNSLIGWASYIILEK